MKDEGPPTQWPFILHPSAFILSNVTSITFACEPGHPATCDPLPIISLESEVLSMESLESRATSNFDFRPFVVIWEPTRACDLACLVPPAGIEHVQAIASNLEKMPPKSTYFYPKLVTGLVLNPLR